MKTFLLCLHVIVLVPLLALSASLAAAATTTLLPTGAIWKYLDTGANLGTAWVAPAFDDSAWAAGPAQLGYGDGGEATVVSYGSDANNRHITTYFRRAFNVSDAAGFASLTLRVVRDDGVVVYLNGAEVYRNNLPAGTITSTTLASVSIGGADESTFYQASISPSLLTEGANVLAVEIHQSSANSSDISFDLELTGERPLMQIALNAPAHGATEVGFSPTLDVSVSHREGLPMTVTFVGRPAPPVGPDFTVVALPDTQFYSSSLNGGSPAIFKAQTDWIVANTAARNIAFVTQLGDCVQNGDNGGNDVEWRVATNALYQLENPLTTLLDFGIPYGVAVGNHDQSPVGTATGTTTFYNQYFGEAHFLGRPYYGGHYGSNNDDHFELFEAGGIKFIVIHFEYDTAMATNSLELDWADQLLKTHSDRQGILVSHWIMNSGESGSFSTQGQAIYDRLKVNPNLFLMLCGHVNPNGEGKRADVYNGRTVHTLLSDYQDRVNGGNGWLRTLEFSPANSVIRVRTYSPTLVQYETDANSQFDLFYDMQSLLGNPYSTLAVNSGVASGITTAVWPGLAVSTEYEWHVSVSDGVETSTSPVWRFRTADIALPLAPSGLLATAQSSSTILLNWTDNAINESGFEVYQSLNGVNYSSMGQMGADVTSAQVTGLQPATTYSYVVRAFNGAGYSADSAVASAITLALPPPPTAPGNLTVTPISTSELTLNWTDLSDTEDGFRIERSTDGVSFSEVNVVTANAAVFSDSGLAALTTYFYRVRAFNVGGLSDYSNIASATTQPPPPPAPPTGLLATAGDRVITLTWDERPGAISYYVHRAEVSGGPYNTVAYGIYTPTWTDTGVTPRTDYFYVVRAVGDGGPSLYSAEAGAAAYALPAAPTDATVTFADFTALELSWVDNATDETGYILERSVDHLNFSMVVSLPADTTYHRDEGLAENTTYFYRIRAFNNDGPSAPAEVSGTTAALPPAAPNNLAATAISSSQIDLTWSDLANNETGFKIERSTSGEPFTPIATLGANVTTFSDGGLTPATLYSYRVRTYNPAGESSAFAEASASTLPLPPAAPTGLTATTISSSGIDLTWADQAANESGYQLERSDAGGPFAEIALLPADVIAFSDIRLTPATTYTYRVRAYNAGGTSSYADPTGATTRPNPPAAPTGLTATPASPTRVDLTWTDHANNETGFEIERAPGAAGSWSVQAGVAASATSYSDTSVAPETTYRYRLRALNTGGYSDYSNESSATTPVPTTTATFTSVAAQDGYVLESSETSNIGGAATGTTSGTSGLRAGDDSKKRQLKSIVSFDTSSIPDGAIIVSATLRLKRGTVSGTNPFQTHGTCFVDIKSSSGFNNSTVLAKEDFQATADAAPVASLSNAASNGQWSEGALNTSGLLILNKSGTTQCRVYFATDDDNDATADYIGWYAGDNGTAANRPQLVVVYQ